jgi:hypothetical protein
LFAKRLGWPRLGRFHRHWQDQRKGPGKNMKTNLEMASVTETIVQPGKNAKGILSIRIYSYMNNFKKSFFGRD